MPAPSAGCSCGNVDGGVAGALLFLRVPVPGSPAVDATAEAVTAAAVAGKRC